MSVLGKLFGGGDKPKVRATPPTPNIGDAGQYGAGLEERYKLKKRRGMEESNLAGLGDYGGNRAYVERPKSTLG